MITSNCFNHQCFEAANQIVQFFHSLSKLQRRLFAATHGFKVYDVPALPSGDSRMKPDVEDQLRSNYSTAENSG